jgi:hypothetical protein
VEGAGQHLRAGADEPLGFGPCDLDLGLAVGQQELDARAAHRLDAAGDVDCLRSQLGTQTAIAPDFRHGTADRAHHADLDRPGLGA